MTSLNKSATAAMAPDEKKAYMSTYFRCHMMLATCFSQIFMQGAGVPLQLLPWLRYLYPERGPRFAEAMERHVRFFNITPDLYTFVTGIVCAMEKEYRDDPENFDPGAIQAIKAALMGPLSGIGDAIFWVTVRTIAASVAIGMAESNIAFAPIVFLFIYHVPSVLFRYFGFKYGYSLGQTFLESAYESGAISMLTKAASTIGLIMVGAMSANFVKLSTTIKLTDAQTLQSALDSILPGLLPLLVTLLCLWALKKNVSPSIIILLMVIIGIGGKGLGIF